MGTGASPESQEDTQLVERCLGGDNQAFEQLFVKHRQQLFAVCWRLLHDEDAALDVVQDAFVKAYEELENLRGEARFYPWLRRIAVNLSIDKLRQAKRSKEVSLYGTQAEEEARDESAAVARASEEQNDSPVEKAEISEFSTALSSALLKLSDPHRTVFMLHAAEGMSYKEIAEALDCNIGTVMSRLFYARKRLQELLGPHLKLEE
jgi:RNA polymerase sigma-70 factor (ECF subfamily)